MDHPIDELARGVEIGHLADNRVERGCDGRQLEAQLDDDAERAERADIQLVQVVAGNVFHHATASAGQGAVRVGDPRTDDQVTCRAVREAQRPAGVGGDQPANRRALGRGRVQREELALLAQNPLELGHTHASFDRDGEVRGLVLDHPIEAGGVDHHVEAQRGHAQIQLCAATDGRDGLAGVVSGLQRGSQILGSARRDPLARRHTIDLERRGGHATSRPRGPDGRTAPDIAPRSERSCRDCTAHQDRTPL